MSDNTAIALVGGLFSLLVAGLSGVIAYTTARENLKAEIAKIKTQEDASERATIVALGERYLTPLRYYGEALSRRLGQVESKLQSEYTTQEMRTWFKTIKDQVTRDRTRDDYLAWCYYEGMFSGTTLYYTCSYFYCAREVVFRRPFGESRPYYSKALDDFLTGVTDAFTWTQGGVWHASPELIGERFVRNGSKMTYAEMCDELTTGELYRRARFFRLVDVYWRELELGHVPRIRSALDELVNFLRRENPQSYKDAESKA
jgi:hypothetical protein